MAVSTGGAASKEWLQKPPLWNQPDWREAPGKQRNVKGVQAEAPDSVVFLHVTGSHMSPTKHVF